MTTTPHLPHAAREVAYAHRVTIASGVMSITGTLVGFPFDSLKTRMQTHKYASLLQCVRDTWRAEGLLGFYRGVVPPLLTITTVKSISFSIYAAARDRMYALSALPRDLTLVAAVSSFSGALTGAAVSVLACPLELVKVQRQLERLLVAERNGNGNGTGAVRIAEGSSWRTARNIYRVNGVAGLYRGFPMQVAKESVGTAVYFGTYEAAKYALLQLLPNHAPAAHFLAGGTCGVLSWLVIFPADLLKSVVQRDAQLPPAQRKYMGFRDAFRDIMRVSGVRGLYNGFSATLVRAFPLHSLNFLIYEQVLKACDGLRGEIS
ncbi:mitochondrial carrier [Gonapodya prolifera JEL478]|uniref:Mitochondrial carrier n=1 Tax=Gonapodya prolifera (strain JEL478) TaxID=1344416 RepID=A0A139AY36_GONPJ|nr:mitochondrial carrier [Gonapodya prolifera JEL478]|eukprot:KXS21658.1 mitochondrial carrier [Gonapodya prolifera JEL478]